MNLHMVLLINPQPKESFHQTRLGFGAQYDWSDSLRVGMSFEWLNLGKNKVNDQFVKGDYRTNDMFFFGFNVNWKKLPWSDRGTF